MQDIALMELILKQCVKTKVTPLVWGKHGIGKSMIIRKLFEAEGYEVVDLRLGQLEVGDLVGVPAQEYYCPVCKTKFGFSVKDTYCPVCLEGGNKKVAIAGNTTWLAPSWFPQHGEKRLLFFDELNRGRLDVQQATFQIVLDRKIHTHYLPDNCGIVCACNPSGQDYVVEELDPALLDRFCNIKFNLTPRAWLEWARTNKIIPEIIDFIMTDGKMLGAEAIDMEIPISASPRSYEMLSKLLSGIPKNHKNWSEVANCVLGEATALAFMNSLARDVEKPVKATEIFNQWDKAKKRIKAQVEDAGEGDVRHDLIRATLDDVYDHLKDGKSKKIKDEQLVNVGHLLTMIPEDLAFATLKDLAPFTDVAERLLMRSKELLGVDLFDILKKARKDDIQR